MAKFEKQFLCRMEKWTFDDYGITIEKNFTEEILKKKDNGELLHFFCPYANIKKIELSKYVNLIQMTYYDKDCDTHMDAISCDDYARRDAKAAVNFALKQKKKNKMEPENFKVYNAVTGNKFNSEEFIMHCEICGQVFRYTSGDIKRNLRKMEESDKMKTPLLDVLIYTPLKTSVDSLRAEEKLKTVKNLNACPQCNSTKVKRISEEEFKEIQEKQSKPTTSPSVVDELKGFKDLLDSGVITQEEFDAKKKQLLGL